MGILTNTKIFSYDVPYLASVMSEWEFLEVSRSYLENGYVSSLNIIAYIFGSWKCKVILKRIWIRQWVGSVKDLKCPDKSSVCACACLSLSSSLECSLSHTPPPHHHHDARTEQKYCLSLNDRFINMHETKRQETKSLESWVIGTLVCFKKDNMFDPCTLRHAKWMQSMCWTREKKKCSWRQKRDSTGLIRANSRTVLPTGLLWNEDSMYYVL